MSWKRACPSRGCMTIPTGRAKLLKERNELEPIVAAFRAYERAKQAQADALEMLSDPDMKELAQEELQQAKADMGAAGGGA